MSDTFITAGIFRSCLCAQLRAMFIYAEVVRELVRDIVRAALIRATLITPGIIGDYVKAHFHSCDNQGLLQSHIIYGTIVRVNIGAALSKVEQ